MGTVPANRPSIISRLELLDKQYSIRNHRPGLSPTLYEQQLFWNGTNCFNIQNP